MSRLIRLLPTVAPFLIGLVSGALLLYFINTWGIALEDFVRWLAISASVIVVLAIVLWLLFKYFTSNAKSNVLSQLKRLSTALEEQPSKLADPEYRKANIWPIVPSLFKVLISWFGFNAAMALLIAFIANLLLLATLSVQYLSAERLENQNTLLGKQNEVFALQTDLLKKQTRASQVEQLLSLDEKLSTLRSAQNAFFQIVQSFKDARDIEVNDERLGVSMTVSNYLGNPCAGVLQENKCLTANVRQIIEAYNDHPGGDVTEYPHEYYMQFQIIADYLNQKNSLFNNATKEISEISEDAIRDDLAYAKSAVDDVTNACALPPDLSRNIAIKLSISRLLESNAHAYGSEKFQNEWKDWADQFEQVRKNISRFDLNFQSGIGELSESQSGKPHDRDSYNLEIFYKDIASFYLDLEVNLDAALEHCSSEVDRITSIRDSLN